MARKPTKQDVTLLAMAGMMGGSEMVNSLIEREGGDQTLAQNGQQKIHLPSKMSPSDKLTLIKMGCIIGEQVEGDNLFLEATIPAGWKFRKTEHYMYQDLCDEQGRKRGQQMYKAAFYDRDASFYCVPRFSVDSIRDDWADSNSPKIHVIRDSDEKVLWRSKPITEAGYDVNAESLAFFNKMFPKYEEARKHLAEVEKAADKLSYNERKAALAEPESAIDCLYWDFDLTTHPNWDVSRQGFANWGSEPPKGTIYTLHVAIYDGDRHVDSGDNSTTRQETDEAAITKLMESGKAMHERYSKVVCSIRNSEGKIIHRQTLQRRAVVDVEDNSCYFYGYTTDNQGRPLNRKKRGFL